MLTPAWQHKEIAAEQMYEPGLAIPVVSLAFNVFGESLRIVLDPTIGGTLRRNDQCLSRSY